MLEELGDPDLAALEAMPVEQLLAAQAAVGARMGPMGAMGAFGPVRDAVVLPEDPGAALADGTAADVPVIVGSTRHEATMFLAAMGMNANLHDGRSMRCARSSRAGPVIAPTKCSTCTARSIPTCRTSTSRS